MHRRLAWIAQQLTAGSCNTSEKGMTFLAGARRYDECGIPQRCLLVRVGIQDARGGAWADDHEIESGLSHKADRPDDPTLVEERHRDRVPCYLIGQKHMADGAAGEELTLDHPVQVMRRDQRG